MEEEILLYLETTEENMQESIDHFKKGLSRIRSGKANPSMLEGVMVDYYGAMTPINQVASIKAIDGRTLVLSPWEKTMLAPVEQAIFQANLGYTTE